MLSLIFLNSYAEKSAYFERKSFKEVNEKSYYTIKADYPVFKGFNHFEQLNDIVKSKIDNNISDFKNEITQQEKKNYQIKDLPLNKNSNTLDIGYKIKNSTNNIISVLFDIGTFYYGAAHPNTTFESLNYDIKEAKVMALDDLFKPKINYLPIIAEFCEKALTQKLTKSASGFTKEIVKPDPEGIKPIADNYKIWNLTPKGLLVTFPPYQVAAYVFGPQEVLIPYSKIKNLMK